MTQSCPILSFANIHNLLKNIIFKWHFIAGAFASASGQKYYHYRARSTLGTAKWPERSHPARIFRAPPSAALEGARHAVDRGHSAKVNSTTVETSRCVHSFSKSSFHTWQALTLGDRKRSKKYGSRPTEPRPSRAKNGRQHASP